MNAGASLSAVPSPIEGSGTAWVLLGSWALSPARPTPIPPRHECRGFSALLVSPHWTTGSSSPYPRVEPATVPGPDPDAGRSRDSLPANDRHYTPQRSAAQTL